MTRYSQQIVDSVSDDLKDYKIKVISSDLENLIIEYLLNKLKHSNQFPLKWRTASFHPAGNVQDAFAVLGEFYPSVPVWALEGKGDGIIESYIFDKKYSVFAPTPARSLLLAIWNYTLLKEKEA